MTLAPPRPVDSAYLSPHSNYSYPTPSGSGSNPRSKQTSPPKRPRPQSALPGASTSFFPRSAKLPLDPFEHLEPPTWDVDVSAMDAMVAMRSLGANAALTKMRNVVLVLGDPQAHALRPLLTSPLLSNSLIILISHDPPTLNDIYATFQNSSGSTSLPPPPALYIIKLQTPIILLTALKLVKVVEQAQALAKAWRRNEGAFKYAERPYVSFVQQPHVPHEERRYHYVKASSQAHGQPRPRHMSTSSPGTSLDHSTPSSSSNSVPRVVLFAERPMPSITSSPKPLTKSSSPLLTPFTPDGLVGEFYTANEYGIEIVPAAGSRGGLFGNSGGSRASSPSSSSGGWSRIFGTKKTGGGGYAESYTEGMGLKQHSKSASKRRKSLLQCISATMHVLICQWLWRGLALIGLVEELKRRRKEASGMAQAGIG